METRYEVLETLRASMFGDILLCVDTHTRDEVVVKTVDVALATKRQARATGAFVHENAQTEIDVLARLSALGGHPNVIAMRACFASSDNRTLYLVLDYCDSGDLLDACITSETAVSLPPLLRLDDNVASGCESGDDAAASAASLTPTTIATTDAMAATGAHRIPEHRALGYVRDVVAGLHFLHTNGVAHRDLSLENILLRHGRAVIADFGLCVQQQQHDAFVCSDIVGKRYYMAPEIIHQQQYKHLQVHNNGTGYDPRAADIWSLGVALFILVTSSPPFECASVQDAGFRFVAKHGVRAVLKAWGLRPALSDACQDVLTRMLQVDVAQRITLPELLLHPAIAGFPTSPVSTSDVL